MCQTTVSSSQPCVSKGCEEEEKKKGGYDSRLWNNVAQSNIDARITRVAAPGQNRIPEYLLQVLLSGGAKPTDKKRRKGDQEEDGATISTQHTNERSQADVNLYETVKRKQF